MSLQRNIAAEYDFFNGLLGQDEAAQALVDQVRRDLEIIENHTYYQSVLFFQGFRTEEALLPEADSIIKFAIAMVHHFEGETDVAEEMWRDIVDGSAQGFWPAEAELVFAAQPLARRRVAHDL